MTDETSAIASDGTVLSTGDDVVVSNGTVGVLDLATDINNCGIVGNTCASCTAGVCVPFCTSFTYFEWEVCTAEGSQTRIIATQSPEGCTGGSPVLSQSCTFNPCFAQEQGDLVGQACTGTTAVYAGVPGYMTTPSNAATKAWSTESIETNVRDVANGATNTATLSGLAGVYPAADYCAALEFGGYDNWYLPAKDELNTVLYDNRVALGAGTGWFWSSTERNTTSAANQAFSSGGQGGTAKTSPGNVRCVRRY